jgi:hypothetical protein
MTEYLEKNTPSLPSLIPGEAKRIAEQFGIHEKTVRMILNGGSGYNPETVTAVVKAAIDILSEKAEYYEQQLTKWQKLIDLHE